MSLPSTRADLKDIAAQKQKQRADKILFMWKNSFRSHPPDDIQDVHDFPKTSGMFTPKELEIMNLTTTEVISKTEHGVLRAEEVVRAICERATVAQQVANCLTEIYFNKTVSQAKGLDV
jgi:amidase